VTRREALRQFSLFLAASPLLAAEPEVDIDQLVNVFDFDELCGKKIPKPAYDYVSGGGWDEQTLQRNRDKFRDITFRPRFMRKVDQLDLSTTLFGQRLNMPILVAPTGSHSLVHPEGEIATARGAGAAGAVMVISSSASFPIEKIAEAATAPLWFQLYAGPDLPGTRARVERAIDAGCQALCYTVDAPYPAPRERDMRNNLAAIRNPRDFEPSRQRRRRGEAPASPYGVEPRFQGTLDWDFFDEMRKWLKQPLLMKGILSPEDAVLAADHGADGVVVSNHGGRYLDGAPATIEVLPEIVDAVNGRIPVLVDSGFRRGTDILKALAIGAKAVLVGRVPLWGLGAFGDAGVQRVLELLRKELAWAMALAGQTEIAAIDRGLIRIDR
jgi:4-hydroxymandelate oxidase